MKILNCFILSLCVIQVCNAQSHFEGIIEYGTYRIDYSKSRDTLNQGMTRVYVAQDGKCKVIAYNAKNKAIRTTWYFPETDKMYMLNNSLQTKDTLYNFGFHKSNQKFSYTLLDTKTKLMGYNCKVVEFEASPRVYQYQERIYKATFYYAEEFAPNKTYFTQKDINYYDFHTKKPHLMEVMVKMEYLLKEDDDYKLELSSIKQLKSLIPKQLDKNIFELPNLPIKE